METLPKTTLSNSSFRDRHTINFLLCCISPTTTTINSQTAQQVRTLAAGDIDWPALVKLAQKHRVVPLLYNRLNTLCPTAIPDAVLEELRNYCQNVTIQNLSTTAELSRLLSLMEANGIDTLPYKGPVLTQTIYKNLSLRQFGDLDIIIQPQDMPSVEKLLIGEGYRPYFGKKTAAELAAYMKSKTEHTYDFYNARTQVFLEIHWRFWPPFFSSVNPQEVWHRRESTTLAGKTVSNFSIEDYLVILCMHGSRHVWQRLSWLCDIALLIHRYPKLNWQTVCLRAQQWGAKRMLFVGLYLAHAWLGATLPTAIMKEVYSEAIIAELADQVDAHIFRPTDVPARFMATTLYQLQARERWQDKAVYAESFLYWLSKGCPSDKPLPCANALNVPEIA